MILGPFEIGQQPIIEATFTDISGGSGVATSVVFMVKTPAGVETSTPSPDGAISNPSPNVWLFTMPVITQSGKYHIRCKDAAGLTAAGEATLEVSKSAFTTP